MDAYNQSERVWRARGDVVRICVLRQYAAIWMALCGICMPRTLKNMTALSALLNGARDLYIIIKPYGLIWLAEAYKPACTRIYYNSVDCMEFGWKTLLKGVWFLWLSLTFRHLWLNYGENSYST